MAKLSQTRTARYHNLNGLHPLFHCSDHPKRRGVPVAVSRNSRMCTTAEEGEQSNENISRSLIMPTLETMSAIRRHLNSLPRQSQYMFSMSTKTVERIIQKYSKRAVGFVISWHSLRTTYVSRSVELEQSPAVVMLNTGDSPATILKYYTKLPEVVMRRFVESKPVIPFERV
jgi:hypothetical protein